MTTTTGRLFHAFVVLLALVDANAQSPTTSATSAARLGSAPIADEAIRLLPPVRRLTGLAQGPTAPAPVDPANRLDVVEFFHCEYLPSEDFLSRVNWTGSIAACDAGTVSPSFHEDTLRRINYYRAMAGVDADVRFDTVKNAKSQQAALAMAANCGLSHQPASVPGWSCVTTGGNEAAGQSNLSLGSGFSNIGPTAIDGQMRDDGTGNIAIGHRRWLLYPRATEMGHGGVPHGTSSCSASIVWVIGAFAPPPSTPRPVSWPNAGYVPYQLAFDRWSFSLAGANFDQAEVSMLRNGSPIAVTRIHPTPASPAINGLGDPTLVWEPAGLDGSAPGDDITYSVTITGVSGAAETSYAYDVTLIDPRETRLSLDLDGPGEAPTGTSSAYAFARDSAASGYTLRARRSDATPWKEGGEAADPNLLIDHTHPAYSLNTTTLAQHGLASFHLAFSSTPVPDFSEQAFELDRTVAPTAGSELRFHVRRRWTSALNTLSAEISTDDGSSWNEVWSLAGVCSNDGSPCNSRAWDSAWIPTAVSLAAYAGTPARLRFVLRANGLAFFGTDPTTHGLLIDEVSVSGAGTLVEETLTPIADDAGTAPFAPTTTGLHLLDLRAHLDCFDSTFGPVLPVHAVAGTPLPADPIPLPAGALLIIGIGLLGAVVLARR